MNTSYEIVRPLGCTRVNFYRLEFKLLNFGVHLLKGIPEDLFESGRENLHVELTVWFHDYITLLPECKLRNQTATTIPSRRVNLLDEKDHQRKQMLKTLKLNV